jgi:general secretion pathway protein H
MQISAVGTDSVALALIHPRRASGFTLLELLIVVAIMAIATAGVGFSLRPSSATSLEREAQRLAVLLESGRAQSRMTANPVRWRPTATGFAFEGLTSPDNLPSNWLDADVQAASAGSILLGPEPVIGPQQVRLVSISEPTRGLTVATDGVRPFSVLTDEAAASAAP